MTTATAQMQTNFPGTRQELLSYDKYIVFFSGGKDSTACYLHLLELGVDPSKIELWHHSIDGREETFMDWEVTEAYCEAFAKAFGSKIYFSWREGGFKTELLKENDKTKGIVFEDENYNLVKTGGERAKVSTRRKFPQVTADLRTRWCSPTLKIDVAIAAIRNQERFKGIKTLCLSGERGEESSARGNYAILEADKSDLRAGKKYQRHVDRWRPIRDWLETEVWAIIERFNVRVHPAYYLGFSRVSCKFCIFGNANQFASAYTISPKIGDELCNLEEDFGYTLKRNKTLVELIVSGTPYDTLEPELMDQATAYGYTEDIIMQPGQWTLPAGAYGEGCGPS